MRFFGKKGWQRHSKGDRKLILKQTNQVKKWVGVFLLKHSREIYRLKCTLSNLFFYL